MPHDRDKALHILRRHRNMPKTKGIEQKIVCSAVNFFVSLSAGKIHAKCQTIYIFHNKRTPAK